LPTAGKESLFTRAKGDIRKASPQTSASLGPDISLLMLTILWFKRCEFPEMPLEKKKKVHSISDTINPKKGGKEGPRGRTVLWNVKYLL